MKLRDPALGVRTYVDVIAWLNLTGGGHDGGQIGFRREARLHRHQIFLTIFHTGRHAAGDQHEHNNAYYYLPLGFHCV